MGSGVPPGDSFAGDIFLGKCIASTQHPRIPALCPSGEAEVNDVSTTSYADDVARTRRFEDFDQYLATAKEQAADLDRALRPIGIHQNKDKQETLVRFSNRGAEAHTRACFKRNFKDASRFKD